MRGRDKKQTVMFSMATIESLVEKRLPADHPLRAIKARADEILRELSPEFDKLYSSRGRPSIAPERLLRALLWMALFSVRSERQLEDVLRFDLRCRWFVGLSLDEEAWDHSTFSRARDSVLLEALAEMFFNKHLDFLRDEGLLSSEHLSVDGTLLAAWASHKSIVKRSDLDKDGNPPLPPAGGRNGWVDFKGEKRSNETHVSSTDPEARLASKGTGAKLAHELNAREFQRGKERSPQNIRFVVGQSRDGELRPMRIVATMSTQPAIPTPAIACFGTNSAWVRLVPWRRSARLACRGPRSRRRAPASDRSWRWSAWPERSSPARRRSAAHR